MGLDKFMGIDSDKPEKKKTSKKKKISSPIKASLNEILEAPNSVKPMSSKSDLSTPELFNFVTLHYKCTSCKKYKKTMKRPHSFTPSEKDLICPKCGSQLKLTTK
ncbi:MAG: hypothetical protein JW776_03400 [Candidatus Lokiarchaeota archaeon]|nr:hypothetical protein [Candidatus Lokiarchaeota archaeon]